MHASFFFIDIVGLSNPSLSTVTQSSKIKVLNNSIAQCKTFDTTPKNERIIFPTGDGMWIAFLNGLEKPVKLAMELQQKLQKFNDSQDKNENIEVRIGCHIGDVFLVNDLQGTVNLWGPGIIMARRVMDAGDSGHILMTSTMADSLIELSDEYGKIIHPIHDFKIKHGEIWLVYSVYGESFGNSKKPQRGIFTSKVENKISEMSNPVHYEDLKLILQLKDPQTNLWKISRTIHFENKSDEPISEIYDIIQTGVPKSFAELNVKAYDENEKILELGGIYLDAKNKKEFSFKLNNPVFRNDKNNEITITYETQLPHRFFEEILTIDIDNFSTEIIFPSNNNTSNPQLFLFTYLKREKLPEKEMKVKRGVTTQTKWENIKNLKQKDLIRIEW